MRGLLRGLKWWGLFALIPLMVVLIVLDDSAPLSESWHMILLGAIACVICALALRWAERNYELTEREGTDALITYRPLAGTFDPATEESIAPPHEQAQPRLPVSSYDLLSVPPVSVSRSEE